LTAPKRARGKRVSGRIAVGHHHEQIGRLRADEIVELRGLERGGLSHGDAQLQVVLEEVAVVGGDLDDEVGPR